MAELYIAQSLEEIQSKSFIASDLHQSSEEFAASCALIEDCNPDCSKTHAIAKSPTPILLPQNQDDLRFSRLAFSRFKNEFQNLPKATQTAIAEIGLGESFSILEGLRDWKKEQISADYGLISLTSDTNSLGSAALGVVSHRAHTLIGRMHDIEVLLKKYERGTGQQRRRLRPQIEAAYRTLQTKFKPVVEKYVNRSRHRNQSRNRIYSAGRAIQGSKRGFTAPLTAKSGALLKVAKNFKQVGRGLIVLDLGIRVNNITHSDNKWRTGVAETAGFALSYFVGYAGANIALGLALGPVGWVVLILGTGVTAVTLDYLGKTLGASVYDNLSSWNLLR